MRVEKALRLIDEEYLGASEGYPPMPTYHDGYAVILEELDELWTEVKKRPSKRDKEQLKEEAIQVAAMALRFLVDLC